MASYIFFLGTSGNYGFLSNFYKCSFTVEGVTFNCSEQYFMKRKQEAFDPDNHQLAQCILGETNSVMIKKYGSMVKNYNDKTWNSLRYNVMCDALHYKFTQNPNLMQNLIETGDTILVEANPHDNIWAIGLSLQIARTVPESEWKGQNLLGKALMHTRYTLSFIK